MSRLEWSRLWFGTSRAEGLFPVAYMGLLYFLSSIPAYGVEPTAMGRLFQWVAPSVQNTLHVPAYAVLALLWCRFLSGWRLSPLLIATIAIVMTTAFGIADEWHQSFVPGRMASATDATSNFAGAVAGTWVYRLVTARFARASAEHR